MESVSAPKSIPPVVKSQTKPNRTPCQVHDAKAAIDRGIFTQETNWKIPCSIPSGATNPQRPNAPTPSKQSQYNKSEFPRSNSTFATSRMSNEHTAGVRDRDQYSRPSSPDTKNTLEWDDYLGTQSDVGKYKWFPPDPTRVKSNALESFGRPKIPNQNMNSTKSNVYQSNFETEDYDEDIIYVADEDQFTSTRRSTSNQNDRRVVFEEPKSHNQKQPGPLTVNSQASTSYASTARASGSLLPEQIAARQVVDKRLETFTGNPMEWPIWITNYENSTELCGLTDGENLGRLTKSIQGKARDVVRSRLTHPNSVPWIIETLRMLYGRPEVIIKAIIDKARNLPSLKSDNLEALMEFAFEVQTICTTIESLKRPNHLSDPMLIEELVEKLPTQEKKDWASYKSKFSNVTIKTLATFLYDLAKLICTVVTPKATKSNDKKQEKEKFERNEKAAGLERVNVHVDQTSNRFSNKPGNQYGEKNPQKKFPCPICQNECNKVESCSKFNSFNIDARWNAVNKNNLCQRCLRKHKGPCRATNVCERNGCQYKHHSILHNDQRHSQPKNNSTVGTTVAPGNFHGMTQVSTMLRIVPVILHNGSKSVFTFAFLDDGTTVTMMEKRLADELGLNGTYEQLCLIWTNKIHRKERAERVSLEISGLEGFDKRYELKGVRTVNDLHLPVQSINKTELIAKYPYLRNVPLVNYKNAIPGIMIGSDMPKFGTQLQIIESEEVENGDFNGPMASRTRLGWSVHGPQIDTTINKFVNSHQFEICPHHNELDNEIHQRVKEYFSVENFGVQANSKLKLESKDDERALEMLENLTKKKNGRYETGLLWKTDNAILPDSFPMAMKRLISLERQGPEIIKLLGAKVADYVAKGYARKLSKKDLLYKGPVWYLPLFGVVHPKKPEKLRMVFDAAAKVKSISLNSTLLRGPDLFTSLIDILRRFRERKYTGGGDIVEMYHQVSVIKKDRHFQRFLFRDDNKKTPDIYEMEVMTFGSSTRKKI